MLGDRADRAAIAIGIAAVAAQAVLLRELLARGAGNELALTIHLSWWLAGSAIGSRLWGRRRLPDENRRGQDLPRLLAAGSLLALAGVAIARALPLPGGGVGEEPGLLAVLLLGAATLLPVGLLTAGLFPRIPSAAGRAYVAEAVGAAIGGVAVSAAAIAGAAPLAILCGACAVALALAGRSWAMRATGLALAVAALTGPAGRLDAQLFRAAWERSHPGITLLEWRRTPSRTLVLAEREGERWVLADDQPRAVLGGLAREEALAALLVAAGPAPPRTVLVVDGGSAPLAEVMAAAGVDSFVALLPDRAEAVMVGLAGEGDAVRRAKARAITGDPRAALRRRDVGRWDRIVWLGGEASSISGNRLWTREAFRGAAAMLAPAGVLVALAPGGEAARGVEAQAWRSSVASALASALGEEGSVAAIDADRFVLVGSRENAALRGDSLAARLRRSPARLPTYPPERFLVEFPPERIVSPRAPVLGPVNTDLRPAAFVHALDRWLRRGGGGARIGGVAAWLVVLAALLACGSASALRPRAGALVAVGAVAIGLDLLVLMLYQARVGILEAGLGALLGLFLGGTAIGAALASHEPLLRRGPSAALAVPALATGAALPLLLVLPAGPPLLATAAFGATSLLLGAACGFAFPPLAAARGGSREGTAARAWAFDAAGGIVGAFLVLAVAPLGFAAIVAALLAALAIGGAGLAIAPRRRSGRSPLHGAAPPAEPPA